MYHYVRDLSKSRYPDINALTVDEFRYQLDYLESEYTFITVDELQSALLNDEDLPENAVLLTFDDGFADHYETVFPILTQRGIQGAFFPPVDPIENETVLDVHKIHTILAERDSDEKLLNMVLDILEQYQSQFELKPPRQYYDELAEEGRWDPEEIVFVKRLLQYALPDKARGAIIDDLFDQYLSVDEEILSQEWYMTKDQLRVMVDNGMYIGSHTANHYWLDTLSRQEVVNEIETSLDFLDSINSPTEEWMMCYPYGRYNEKVIDVLKRYGCNLAFTTEPRVANTVNDNPLEVPRLDTNDLPQSAGRYSP
ncbi:polysaccharide deacetylase family protein [Halopenitus sp. POP-27]|uniref:polysaccharide deacetylase family protein n=1 Tax=Halopenitus sp. POP-27 TaxID=2994425 RepID=UPI002469383D|nr:polysaccharide deacetylase family protein [Halopenitus sp. POP-27]